MSQQGDNKSELLLDNVAKAKRHQVTAACQGCRRKKVKCDGRRPCGDCSRRGVQCEYAAQENETPQQALKRKYDDLSRIYEGLASQDEDQAIETLRRIRAGHQVDSILRHVYQREDEPILQQTRRLFLLALAQSTAALDDIVRLASSVLLNANARVNLPSIPKYEPLRDTIVTIDDLYDILSDSPSRGLLPRIPDGSHDGPVFWVPASPWTTLTDNDEAVSHLVSLYLCNMNPFWRFLEEDIFLRAMRSRKPSIYCSSLLVHAVLAGASLYSEIEEVYSSPGKTLNRGEHFHCEALRLLGLEDQKATITNVQAMLILGAESAKRGRDRLGLELVYRAAAMVKYIPAPESRGDDFAELVATRVRSCLISSVTWANFAFIQSLYRDEDKAPFDAADGVIDIANLLPDTTAYWRGFPLKSEPVPFRMNLLLQERTKLVPIMADIVRPYNRQSTKRQLLDSSSATAWRLHEWQEALPAEVAYSNGMPVPLYELHAHFVDLNMGLYQRALKRLAAINEDDDDLAGFESQLQARSLTWAHRSAKIARDFRETYGCKINAAHVTNMAAVASLILLRLMKQPLSVALPSQPPSDSKTSNSEIHEMENSFAECFRCLLSAGLQEMNARGIARMVYCTALEFGVTLPESVQQMNRLLAESAWQPSDVNQLSSTYPNWATVDQSENNMEDMLRKWQDLAIQDQASLASAQNSLATVV